MLHAQDVVETLLGSEIVDETGKHLCISLFKAQCRTAARRDRSRSALVLQTRTSTTNGPSVSTQLSCRRSSRPTCRCCHAG